MAPDPDPDAIVWRDAEGGIIACFEKNKVMRENFAELRQFAQDAFEDAVLMGCDEQQVREALVELMAGLVNPYAGRR
ncbi:MAG: hypothetical protein CVU17_08880 [Betaproteobacteria bacterium HGW-Betaproteobacteria-11]|nr:MAG: hypothetical protein CVU17_08880 [Betaproteobacteria bacterium HGW-Betaproteobacteria-11]